ncbi:MAG: hypothetical protein ACE5GW_02540, partial [Planctomycetota bacterium]
ALLLSFVGLGALQALQEFGRFGMSQLIISLWRLLGGGALAAFGMGVAGALTGALIGPISVLPWAFRRVSRRLGGRAAGASGVAARALIRDAIPILLTAGAFLALVHLDVPFAQACFGGQESPTGGIYNASATLARSILYVALPICTVTYARVSRAVARGSPHRPYLWKNLLMTLLLCAGGALILGGMPEEILRLYGGGEKYVQGVGLLRLMLVPMALLSVAAVFLHYHLALGRRHPAVVTPAAVVAAVLLYRGWHGEPEDLVRGLTVVSGALVAGNVICLVPGVGSWRRPTPPA